MICTYNYIFISAVLEEPIGQGEWEAIQKVKKYYQSCINTGTFYFLLRFYDVPIKILQYNTYIDSH